LFQAHKLLLIAHGPAGLAHAARSKGNAANGNAAADAAPPVLPFSSIYSQSYIQVCYMLFYLHLGWHHTTYGPLYDLDFAHSVVQFGSFVLQHCRKGQNGLGRRNSLEESAYYLSVLAAFELGFDSLALLIAALKEAGGKLISSEAVCQGDRVSSFCTESGTQSAKRKGAKLSRLYQWKLRAHAKSSRQAAAGVGPCTALGTTNLHLDTGSIHSWSKLKSRVLASQGKLEKALALLSAMALSGVPACENRSFSVFMARDCGTSPEQWAPDEVAYKAASGLPGLRCGPAVSVSQSQTQSQTQSQALDIPELSDAVLRGILHRLKDFTPMLGACALAEVAALTLRMSEISPRATTTDRLKSFSFKDGASTPGTTFRRYRDSLLIHCEREHGVGVGTVKTGGGGLQCAMDASERQIEAIIIQAAHSYSVSGSSRLISLLVTDVLLSDVPLRAVLLGQYDAVLGIAERCAFAIKEYCDEEKRYALVLEQRALAHGLPLAHPQSHLLATTDGMLCEEFTGSSTVPAETEGLLTPSGVVAVQEYQSNWSAHVLQLQLFLSMLEIIRGRDKDNDKGGSGDQNGGGETVRASVHGTSSSCSARGRMLGQLGGSGSLRSGRFTDSYNFTCGLSDYTPASAKAAAPPEQGRTVRALRALDAILTHAQELELLQVLCEDNEAAEGDTLDAARQSVPSRVAIEGLISLCAEWQQCPGSTVSCSRPEDLFWDCVGLFCAVFSLQEMTVSVNNWLKNLKILPHLPRLCQSYQLPHPRSEGIALLGAMRKAFDNGLGLLAARASHVHMPGPSVKASTRFGTTAGQERPTECFQDMQGSRTRPLCRLLLGLICK